jgi:hypothetical protein
VLTLLLKQTKLKCAWQIALILLVVMAGAVLVLAFDSQKTLTQPGHDVWWRQNKMSASAVSILRDGTHQEAGVSFELYSLTPFYQTAWFYGLCLLGLLLLIAGLYKLRIKSLKKRELELEILVELNTRELREQRALLQEQKAYHSEFYFCQRSRLPFYFSQSGVGASLWNDGRGNHRQERC